LEHLIETQKHGRRTFNEERWLIDQFNKTDRDHTGSLNFDELWKLFNRLNLEVSEQYCRSIFKVSLYIYLHNYI
jgi:Ca2+-binding EF-hand superfamily protein